MSLINLGLVFVAGLDLGLAVLIFFLNPKNKVNILIALTLFFIATWTLGMGMFRNTGSEMFAWFWAWVQNGSGAMIPIFLFLISIYFPYQSFVLKKSYYILILFSILLILAIVVIPGAWVRSIIMNNSNNTYALNRFGVGYFNLHFYFYLVLAYFNFIKKLHLSSGLVRTQLTYFVYGTIILAVFGSILAAIIPLVLGELGPYWIGPYFAVPTAVVLLRFIYKKD